MLHALFKHTLTLLFIITVTTDVQDVKHKYIFCEVAELCHLVGVIILYTDS